MVEHELAKAETNYRQAVANAGLGFWDLVANRLYYSLFHAVAGLMISRKLTISTHKGALLMFGRHFVSTGLFSKEEGRLFSRMMELRSQSDYNCLMEASREDVEHFLAPTEAFIAKAKGLALGGSAEGEPAEEAHEPLPS